MTYRTWIIQLLGILLIMLLLFFTLPLYTQRLPPHIAHAVAQRLDDNGLTWTKVKTDADHRNITLSGHTNDPKAHQHALELSRSLWFVKHIQDDITPKQVEPYTMQIRWNGNDLSVTGYVNSDKDKEQLEQYIQQQFANNGITNTVETAVGAPKNWQQLVTVLLKQIKTLPLASVYMVDQTVHIAGRSLTTKEITALQNIVSPFDVKKDEKGYAFTTNIAALDKAALVCQKEFNRLLATEKIRFKTGNASIARSSDKLLTELADTAIFCANSTIMITGHTDNVGKDDKNLMLSEQRAKAVKGRLFNQGGVPLERLKTMGKGANQPIANNDTDAGRAKNRRIEFTVKGI